MIQIIPVETRKPFQRDGNGIYYIENTPTLDSIAKKYNWAIENIVLKQDDEIICFRHDDTEFRTQPDFITNQVQRLFDDHCGVVGVIGTIALENSCQWWQPNRHINGSGYIIQGGKRAKVDKDNKPILDENNQPIMEPIEYPMADHPGTHDYLATVDGCCMWIPRRLFAEGLRFDANLKGYHFYDTDICCQALERGYKVSTVNVIVKHNSEGVPPPNIGELQKVFFEKWNSKIDCWPITRLTKFR